MPALGGRCIFLRQYDSSSSSDDDGKLLHATFDEIIDAMHGKFYLFIHSVGGYLFYEQISCQTGLCCVART